MCCKENSIYFLVVLPRLLIKNTAFQYGCASLEALTELRWHSLLPCDVTYGHFHLGFNTYFRNEEVGLFCFHFFDIEEPLKVGIPLQRHCSHAVL